MDGLVLVSLAQRALGDMECLIVLCPTQEVSTDQQLLASPLTWVIMTDPAAAALLQGLCTLDATEHSK